MISKKEPFKIFTQTKREGRKAEKSELVVRMGNLIFNRAAEDKKHQVESK